METASMPRTPEPANKSRHLALLVGADRRCSLVRLGLGAILRCWETAVCVLAARRYLCVLLTVALPNFFFNAPYPRLA